MGNFIKFLRCTLIGMSCLHVAAAVSMDQFDQSLDMMRNGCAPKLKLAVELVDQLRAGVFVDDNKDLRCYTKCIAQLAGTMTKKGDFSVQKALAQIPIILPAELHEAAKSALSACKDVQQNYKDSCDRVYYLTKCVHDFNPGSFKFP